MKTLKVLLQEVVSGIKAWVNSNFAQESNTVHKTGNETVNGVKTFSSANILSEVNRVDKGLWFNGQREAYIFPENAASYSGLLFTTESYGLSFKFGDSTTSNDEVSFNFNNAYLSIYAGYYSNDNKNKVEISPRNADESSLGTSTYQWNNVYAKNYYYNGTAWGLDKDNTWSVNNEFKAILALGNSGEIWFKNRYIDDFTTNPEEYAAKSILQTWNKDNTQYSGGLIDYQMTDGTHTLEIVCYGYPLNDTTAYQHRFRFESYRDGTASFHPTYNNVGLGTSTNKWKSFNGLNPGLLSMPNGSVSAAIEVDITDWYVQDPDYPDDPTKKIIDDSTTHNVTSAVPGWIHISFPNVSGNYAYARKYLAGTNMSQVIIADGIASDMFPNIALTFPIENTLVIRVKAKSASVRIFPCLGNV